MTEKTKILLFIDWYLPGYRAGGPTRSCANLIENLHSDFDFSVITRDTDYMCNDPYLSVRSNEWNILPDKTRVFYFSKERLSKKEIYNLLKNEKYDYVYVNGIFSMYFTLVPLQYFKGVRDQKIILASRGMLANSALSIKKWKKIFFLFFARKINLFANITFHATNEQEAYSIRRIFKNTHVIVAPNLPEKNAHDGIWKQKTRSGKLLKLVCVARIAPEKNIKYALEVLKSVTTDVQFDLFGPIYNQSYWDECKKIINDLPLNIKVNFMGSIESQKVSEAIAKYDFFFLPTRGENFGHVILQAMRIGVPVIISDKTMWQRLLDKQAGWDIPLLEKDKFVLTIETCSKFSQHDYDVLSKGAFDFALSFINNKEAVEQSRLLFVK